MGDPEPLWGDRREAGEQLALKLKRWVGRSGDCTVVGLPRGGVAVAAAIATELRLPITTWSVRKLALPQEPEHAIGAIAPGGVELWDDGTSPWLASRRSLRARLLHDAQRELERRRQCYGDAAAADLRGRHLLLVDDGIATGLTACAAIDSLRLVQPATLTLAVPVVDRQIKGWLAGRVDALVCLAVVSGLQAVGQVYTRFEQLDDRTVLQLLSDCRSRV